MKTDFDNGEHYYRIEGHEIWLPKREEDRPNGASAAYDVEHAEGVPR